MGRTTTKTTTQISGLEKGRREAVQNGSRNGDAAVRQEAVRDNRLNGVSEDGGLNLKSLKSKKIGQLAEIARNFNVEGGSGLRKQDLIFSILQAQAEQSGFYFHLYWLSIATVLHMREFMLEANFQSTFSKEEASTRRTPAQYAFVQPNT